MDRFVLWVAQGFFIGRMPFAPGTFGSLLGLVWFATLVASGRFWVYAAGCLFGLACSVWFCGKAETILSQTDPGSVVLDEIAAMPCCFAAWLWAIVWVHGELPALDYFFAWPACLGTALIFAAFRFFDIVKPWPIRQSQSLPGGWGVTIDDLLAAACVNLSGVAILKAWTWLHH